MEIKSSYNLRNRNKLDKSDLGTSTEGDKHDSTKPECSAAVDGTKGTALVTTKTVKGRTTKPKDIPLVDTNENGTKQVTNKTVKSRATKGKKAENDIIPGNNTTNANSQIDKTVKGHAMKLRNVTNDVQRASTNGTNDTDQVANKTTKGPATKPKNTKSDVQSASIKGTKENGKADAKKAKGPVTKRQKVENDVQPASTGGTDQTADKKVKGPAKKRQKVENDVQPASTGGTDQTADKKVKGPAKKRQKVENDVQPASTGGTDQTADKKVKGPVKKRQKVEDDVQPVCIDGTDLATNKVKGPAKKSKKVISDVQQGSVNETDEQVVNKKNRRCPKKSNNGVTAKVIIVMDIGIQVNTEDQCGICCKKIKNLARVEGCFHEFCFECLENWGITNVVCPTCKGPYSCFYYNIKEDSTYKVYKYFEVPQESCSICKGAFQNRATLDSCLHSFCFPCISELSKTNHHCPVCNDKFEAIYYNIKEDNTYEIFEVQKASMDATRECVGATQPAKDDNDLYCEILQDFNKNDKWVQVNTDSQCRICEKKIKNLARVKGCFHEFCYDCLQIWNGMNPNCPTCEQPFSCFHYDFEGDSEYKVFNRNHDIEQECSICLMDFENKSMLVDCRHNFCISCIIAWSKKSRLCPLCNGKFNTIYHRVNGKNSCQIYDVEKASNLEK